MFIAYKYLYLQRQILNNQNEFHKWSDFFHISKQICLLLHFNLVHIIFKKCQSSLQLTYKCIVGVRSCLYV